MRPQVVLDGQKVVVVMGKDRLEMHVSDAVDLKVELECAIRQLTGVQ